MKGSYNIGKYQYNNLTLKLGASLLVAGITYAILTKKSPLSILGFGLVASIAGFSIGAIINPPKRVIE